MEKDVMNEISKPLEEINVFVHKIYSGVEDDEKTLFIVIDSEKTVDTNLCVKASKIINPILDKMKYDFSDYVIDVCSKGEENE